jgi:microcystin degradation protein MlrC
MKDKKSFVNLPEHTSRRRFVSAIGVGAAASVMPGSLSAADAGSESPRAPGKRIAVAGLFEEVNTFAVESLGYAEITGNMATGFQRFSKAEIIKEYQNSATQLGGYIDGLAETGAEIIPTVYYSFSAGPTIDGEAYRQMKSDIIQGVEDAMPVDGVLLAVHGAGIADGVDDVEGDLFAAIREAVGPDVKIGASLDLHATMTPQGMQYLDYNAYVRHYPHTDYYEVSRDTAKVFVDICEGKIKPFHHFETIPFIMQCLSTMPGNTYARVRQKVDEFGKRKGIYDLSLQYGFPWADVKYNTAAVSCWAKSQALATDTALEFADWLWSNRADLVDRTLGAREALSAAADELVVQGRISAELVRKAKERDPKTLYDQAIARLANAVEGDPRTYGFVPDDGRKGPVVIAEKSDNPGAGAPGDSTHVLAELIKNGVKQACVSSIQDAETARRAVEAGPGKFIDVELGGKLSKLSGEPIRGKAYVKSISDGRYTIIGPMLNGLRLDMGPAAGLQIDGVDVVVISGQMQAFDNGQMKIVGFDPMDYRIVVLKSAVHFRAYWTDIASEIVDCDPPGIASNDLTIFQYRKKSRRVFPLDSDATYPERS